MEPIVENVIQRASDKGRASVLFDWENDELEARFVEKNRDDKDVFPEGFEIGFGSEGITVSWENIM
ncbi:hypothetical protein JK159_09305 [Weissella minor]|nr:hypothetical protein [Weissella minor]